MTARAKIDDAEPVVADSKAGGRVNKSSSIVWPAMSHSRHQPIKRGLIEFELQDLLASRLLHTFGLK